MKINVVDALAFSPDGNFIIAVSKKAMSTMLYAMTGERTNFDCEGGREISWIVYKPFRRSNGYSRGKALAILSVSKRSSWEGQESRSIDPLLLA